MSLAARENLLDIFRAANVALFFKDLRGRYLFMNDTGASLVGKTAEQIIGKTDHQIFSPRTADVITLRDLHISGLQEPFAYDCRSTLLGDPNPLSFHSIKLAVRNTVDADATGLLCLSLRTDQAPELISDLRDLLKHLVRLRPERLLSICRRGTQPCLV